MSWNNVIPAWVLAADSVINEYYAGRLDYDRAKSKLTKLGAPDTMIKRLDNKPEASPQGCIAKLEKEQ